MGGTVAAMLLLGCGEGGAGYRLPAVCHSANVNISGVTGDLK